MRSPPRQKRKVRENGELLGQKQGMPGAQRPTGIDRINPNPQALKRAGNGETGMARFHDHALQQQKHRASSSRQKLDVETYTSSSEHLPEDQLGHSTATGHPPSTDDDED